MAWISKLSLACIFLSTLTFFSSCKKKSGCPDSLADNYIDGATKDNGSCTYNNSKLSKAWLLTHYDVSGIDSTLEFLAQKPNFSISFFTEKTYKELYNPQPGVVLGKNGVWEFAENYTILKLTEKPSEYLREFTVTDLGDTTLSIVLPGSLSRTYTFKAK